VKPQRTSVEELERLEAERHRDAVQRLAPIERPACARHGWHPPGPGSQNVEALASLCPYCYAESRRTGREEERPETRTVELDIHAGSPYAQRAWEQRLHERVEAGEALAGTTMEREALRWIDNARLDRLDDLPESAEDRRRRSERHWGQRLGVHNGRRYVPHPARAGP